MTKNSIDYLKSREKQRIKQLSHLKEKMSYENYQHNQTIFSDDYLYYSSYELFMSKPQRKIKGVSYISEWIIYFMVDKTIQSWLNNNPSIEIDTISILDPCCKSGTFTQIIIEYLLVAFKKLHPQKNQQELLTQIIQNNIHSWDSDKEALTICQNRIKNIFNVEPILVKHINPLLENKKFDIIIGNPYYGNLLSEELKNAINSPYNEIVLDIMDWSYKSINDTGEICFIVPHNITFLKSCEAWRKSIHDNCSLHTLIDIDISFQNMIEDNVILGFNKIDNRIIETSSFKDLSYHKSVPQHLFYHSTFFYKMVIYWDEKYQQIQDSFPEYPFKNQDKISVSKENFNENILKFLINTNEKDFENYHKYLQRYIINNSLLSIGYEKEYLKELPDLNQF